MRISAWFHSLHPEHLPLKERVEEGRRRRKLGGVVRFSVGCSCSPRLIHFLLRFCSRSLLPVVVQWSSIVSKSCIGCHDMGGNILQSGATLFFKDLQRNGVDTEEGIYNITYYGKGRMPVFGEKCTPRGQCTFGPRLQEDEIKLLAEFVKSQADKGWPRIESYGD